MSNVAILVADSSNAAISEEDRRWAILRWLSTKLEDAPNNEILDAANRLEEFVVRQVAVRKSSEEVISKVATTDPPARKIVARPEDPDAADIPEWLDRRKL